MRRSAPRDASQHVDATRSREVFFIMSRLDILDLLGTAAALVPVEACAARTARRLFEEAEETRNTILRPHLIPHLVFHIWHEALTTASATATR